MARQQPKRRVMYVNTDHDDGQYLREAVVSATSFRRFLPDAEFVLYTNAPGFDADVFDQVLVRDFEVPTTILHRLHFNGQMAAKIRGMIESPADQTLYLGADTLALHPDAATIFDVLTRFDFAAAHAPSRVKGDIPDVPRSFPEFNCDVIAFRRSRRNRAVLRRWYELYTTDRFRHPHDQGSFRYLMWHEDVRVATLPFEFNNRMGKFGTQASDVDDARNRTIIVQNREVIRDIIDGKVAIDDL